MVEGPHGMSRCSASHFEPTGCPSSTWHSTTRRRRSCCRSLICMPLILACSVSGMDVTIAGGHGKIALRLTRLLSERGDRVRSLIRNPDHVGDVEAAGGVPVICDMEGEDDLSPFVAGAD